MAVTVYDYEENQWYVQHANGDLEPCANRATANLLARRSNEEQEVNRIETARLDVQLTTIEGF